MFFIGILIPYTNEQLLSSTSRTARSPLTIALADAGIGPAAHLINGLIVVSVISAGNSSLYVSSRTIVFMARNGMAPSLLGRTNKHGVPWTALLFSNLFACIAFMAVGTGAGVVYEALITLSGGTSLLALALALFIIWTPHNPLTLDCANIVATFIVWGVIEYVHIRFRRALKAQGEEIDTLPFKAMWYPYGTYAALAANIFLIFFQGS